MKTILLASTAVAALLATSPAFADAETDALRKEIRLLEARLNKLEKEKTARPAAPVAAAPLEKRVAIVERKQENAEEAAKALADKTPSVEVGSKGFAITSPDKQYQVRMRAYAQADYRGFTDRSNVSNVDTFLLRSARPIIDAKMTDYFSARLMLDFGQGTTKLLDAYGDFHATPESNLFNLRVGKFKVPVGLERWESEQELEFVERGLTTNLVPFRDIGAMVLGDIVPGRLEYQLGVVNGAADIAENNGDADNGKDVVARLFAHPFGWNDASWLRGFGLGVAGTAGSHNGSSAAPGLVTGYVSNGQGRFFTYSTGTFASGTQWRLNPQAMYYNGPFGLIGEYVRDAQQVKNGATQRNLTNDAWLASASYVLTGEDANFDGVNPASPFNPRTGKWGAFELVARAGSLSVDKHAFPLFASAAASAHRADEAQAGINWYLNNSLKLNLDYSWTTFDGGAAAGGDRQDEKVILARTQFRF